MSDSVRPHRQQPTRLPCPWDSPGKNTGVGCHCLLQWMKVKSESEVARSCLTLSDPMDCSPPGSSIHGTFQARVLEWGAIVFSVSYSSSYLFTRIWYAEYALLLETQSTISVTPSSPGSLTLMTIVSVSLLLCFSCLSEWWFPLAICPYSLVFSHEHFPRWGGGSKHFSHNF